MQHLAGDIGGTNARFATYVDGGRTGSVDLATSRYDDAGEMLADAAAALPRAAYDGCCLAVAGPVFDGGAKLTNADISFSVTAVAATTGCARVELVNDMVALGTAVAELPQARFEKLGGTASEGTRGVLAAGTGLGMGVVADGRCLPSEGGHARVAPVGGFERELVAATEHECDEPVSWEHYLSGRGMVALYRAVNAVWGAKPHLASPEDVIARGTDGSDPVADTTLDTWAGMLATAAGGLAVTALTLGGIYLAGGVAVAVQERLRTPMFRRRFEEAAWAADFLADVPVYLVADPHTALDGAAIIAATAAQASRTWNTKGDP